MKRSKVAPEQKSIEEPLITTNVQPTHKDGPFPTFFTCRHDYEDGLIEEIERLNNETLEIALVGPGLVRVDGLDGMSMDPVYALQCLPGCRVLQADSIKGLAKTIATERHFREQLSDAPRNSLVVHAVVPGMCKGQRDPIRKRRVHLVADQVCAQWQKQYPAARKTANQPSLFPLLLQIMLLSHDTAAVSLAPCRSVFWGMPWPNPNMPLGIASVDIQDKMPSSAYRKLLEAFALMRARPSRDDIVVDLGASPGGWTAAMQLLCGCRVVAVDRSELDRKWMRHPRIEFIQGDAFAYKPPEKVDWMVSDVICYPERVAELLQTWCGLASFLVVTIKFRGERPAWEALESAMDVAISCGYQARAKHFFCNKNEVTLMLREDAHDNHPVMDTFVPLYDRSWPKPQTTKKHP